MKSKLFFLILTSLLSVNSFAESKLLSSKLYMHEPTLKENEGLTEELISAPGFIKLIEQLDNGGFKETTIPVTVNIQKTSHVDLMIGEYTSDTEGGLVRTFKLGNLKGKTIRAIFNRTFHGGEGGFGLFAGLANTRTTNSAGVRLTEFNHNFQIGWELGKVDITIVKNQDNANVTVNNQGQAEEVQEDMNKILDHRLN